MAPRLVRAKKTADVKAVENEVPKKARGKAKANSEPDLEVDKEEDIVAVSDKKPKRGGKKGVNENQKQNGITEDDAPPVKKGKKKNSEESAEMAKSNDNSKESSVVDENERDDETETNGDVEVAPSSKGRKKQLKKEVKPKETAKGKKTKQDAETDEAKPKSKGRARKAKQDVELDENSENGEEEEKPEPAPPKSRRKGKPAQEKSTEGDKESDKETEEEKGELEPKKKESKSRKNAGKKGQAKEESEDQGDIVKEETGTKKKDKKEQKKEDIDKGEPNPDEDSEENLPEAKAVKGKRGQKKGNKESEQEDFQDGGEPVSKRRRKAEDKAPEDTKKANKSVTDYESLDFSNSSKNAQDKEWNFKISTWNVDGVRAWLSKGGLDYVKYEKPDILCLQEIKCSQDKLPSEITNLPGYHAYWLCSEKDGYAGVGVYTTKLAMNVQYGLQNEELDSEGRIITAEYEQFYLICTYVPNAGRKLVTLPKRLQWNEEFRKHVQALDKKKPVIICGDMNVAHNEIDLTNPKTNKKNAGFTEEERAGMTELLGDGFVDVYRHYYPDQTGAYTFWSYMFNSRSKNVGWRLDYFIVSERLLPVICDSVIRDKVYGSDHCPLSLFLHLTSADKPKE